MTEAQWPTLDAFERALRREAHNLAGRPDLTWQQLHNRLQWMEGPARDLASAEAARRAADPEGPVWFRTRTPFREAEALLRTLPHDGVQTCALAPNGALLISSGVDGSLRLWDTSTGVELARVEDPDDPVVSCAFDCTGEFLVAGSQGGRVRIRNARTLAKLAELTLDEKAPAHAATSPVEPLAAIALGTALRVVELPSGRERVARNGEASFTCCAVTSGGELIATGDGDGALKLWSADTLDEQVGVTGDWRGGIRACAVSPTTAFVAGVFTGSAAVLLMGGPDETGKPQTTTITGFAGVNDCCLSPDGRWLVSAGDDHLIWLQELEDLQAKSALEGHDAPVVSCTFAADGSFLATASLDGTVKLWDPWRAPSRGGITGHRDRVTSVAFAPDGSYLVSASADMTLKTWDPGPTAERGALEGHLGPVWDCIVLEGGKLIASAAGDGTIRLWDVESEQEARVLNVAPMANVHALACSPDGSLLAAGHDSSVGLWDLATGERRSEADRIGGQSSMEGVGACAFTPDGGSLLLGCEDGTLRLWDVAAWRELTVLRGHAGLVSCCAAVPGTSLAVSGGMDATLRLWDLDSEAELHAFSGHTDAIWDCAVSADGAIAVSVGWDGTLRLWEVASRAPVATFSVPVGLRSVALHPSEHRVALGDVDGWVRVVDAIGLRLAPPPAQD